MRKAKASLITSVVIGLLAVCTAGVSTYAWFQANASATISASESSCDITVSAPDDIDVDTTSVYMYEGDADGLNVDDDFTPVPNAEDRVLNNFWPGDIVTFAIKVASEGRDIATGSMNITYRALHLSNRTIQGTSGASTRVVSILSAINISTGANASGDYPASLTDAKTPDSRTGELFSDIEDNDIEIDDITYYYKEDSVEDAIDDETIGDDVGYFFYTIEFKDVEDTYFIETDSGGVALKDTPRDDESTRFFTGANAGNSTCYEGLIFNVTAIDISIS